MGDMPASVSGRVWKRVRLREDEPPDSGGDAVEKDGGPMKPVSFRDAVLNSKSDIGSMEDDWEKEDLLRMLRKPLLMAFQPLIFQTEFMD